MTHSQSPDLTIALASRYAIERELGAGGMATVYLARDLRHDRKVALKVLRPDLAATIGAERFLAEIRTTASLQHPHILPLHDSGEADGFLFYVMPFVEGESLRDRLARERQLSIDDAVRTAREVSDALGYAHAHGVIHRDVKPENILLHGGHAVVADFGIALAVQQAGGARLTQTGLSLGTPQYMSPEQAMGERVIDARADIYALGAVLYEMLTGEPPFSGPSVQSVVAKVMTERPVAPHALRDTIPLSLESAVLKALAKLPADRFATTADFATAMGGVVQASSIAVAATAPRSRATAVAFGLAAISIGLAAWAWLGPHTAVQSNSRRFSIALPDSAALVFVGPTPYQAGQTSLAISPDGRHIAYLGTHAGTTGIYVRDLNDYAIKLLAGTERAFGPFFSPDGRSIGFFVGNELKRIEATGGPVTTLAAVDMPTGAAWGENGYVLVSDMDGRRLVRVRETGSSPETVRGTMRDRRNFPRDAARHAVCAPLQPATPDCDEHRDRRAVLDHAGRARGGFERDERRRRSWHRAALPLSRLPRVAQRRRGPARSTLRSSYASIQGTETCRREWCATRVNQRGRPVRRHERRPPSIRDRQQRRCGAPGVGLRGWPSGFASLRTRDVRHHRHQP
jgi:serine/threonine-protein kinase